jgi:hypothetical protein
MGDQREGRGRLPAKPRQGIAKAIANVLLSDPEARKRAGVSNHEMQEFTAL